ncbi:MAG: cytochrome b562 [Bdellovibrionota bacterium]
MKNFLVLLSLVFLSQGAAAQFSDLQSVMKEMGPRFKALSMGIADPAKNEDSIRLLGEIGALVQEGTAFLPPNVINLPALEKRPAELRYVRTMLELRLAAIDAEEALNANDQAKAQAAVKQMNTLRIKGHGEF